MTAEELEGWPKFKIPVKKTVRSTSFDLKNSKNVHPWLYKSQPELPDDMELKRANRVDNKWRPDRDTLRALRAPYIKPPIEERLPSNVFLMSCLRKEEKLKIATNWPREVETFKAGDKIKVTKFVTLARDSKLEVIKGMCIGRSNKGIESYFRIINYKIDVMYEMNIPLWSPFIKSIEVLHHGNFKRRKAYFMKARPWQEYIVR